MRRLTKRERIVAQRAGRHLGSVQAVVTRPMTLRIDELVLARWRTSGKGWKTRAAAVLTQHAPAA